MATAVFRRLSIFESVPSLKERRTGEAGSLEIEVDNVDMKEKLMRCLKKEVKQIMEEAVTRKYINEDSSTITSLCACVEACLAYGLKRRTLGLFKTASSTAALLQKISKHCEEAETVRRMLYDFEPLVSMTSFGSKRGIFDSRKGSKSMPAPALKKIPGSLITHKYLWIRIALLEKVLDKIVDYLVANAEHYYSPESLIGDRDDGSGQLIASLLVGPCALDFSRMKTPDHLWTDPSADELVLRHRIHGSAVQYQLSNGSLQSPKCFGLKTKHRQTCSSTSSDELPRGAAKDYVESLHQNSKSTLLYGKNNVMMRPRDSVAPMQGYLSLHQNPEGVLIIKWTPNQLMNTPADESFEMVVERSQCWDFAMCILVPTIVYIHCHHQHDNSGSLVLVGQDGIQYPPLQFPPGGHLLAFLSCLETGLEASGSGELDPPLFYESGVGKVFPPLKRKSVQAQTEPEATSYDYVFRVVCDMPELTDSKMSLLMQPEHPLRLTHSDQNSSSNSTTNSLPSESPNMFDFEQLEPQTDDLADSRGSMQKACDTMKRQILTRAFYGWVAHCRHLRTVRRHLSGLVVPHLQTIDQPVDASKGLTSAIWASFRAGTYHPSDIELCRLVYFGGVEPSLRKEVWPCLLQYHPWNSTAAERQALDQTQRIKYEDSMSEWMAVEAIIRQKDKEAFAASLANCRMTNQHSGDIPLVGKDASLSNEVFEDDVMSISPSDTPSDWTLSPSGLDGKGSVSTSGETGVPVVEVFHGGEGGHDFGERMKHVSSAGYLGEDMNRDSECPSPASSIGGIFANELIEEYSLNLHRIDKDVARCDRTYWYFTQQKNLEKLRNIMNTFVWQNLKEGYVQGMCDIAAPLLVIFDDEVVAYGCFVELMKRLTPNFPLAGGGMDRNFANMRSLIQVLDPELFSMMKSNGDYTHFYFCYRWFLLDFKRELVYDDVFVVWESIWAASKVASDDFVLFLALAMLECYRDIILDNAMDFTDIIKFFNEMAERHDGKTVLKIGRDLVQRIQDLIVSQ